MATRRERVVLQLQDDFTGPMARTVAATKALDASLDQLDKRQVRTVRSARSLSHDALPTMGRNADTAGSSIDRLSGRLGLLVKAAGALGPAFVPIGAATVPVLAGLTVSLGAAALGAGVLVTAFQGVGEALELVNKAELEPTVENVNAANEAMDGLAVAAQAAVWAMQDLRPVLRDIRDSAAGGFFPGFVEGLHDLEALAPSIERIFGAVGESAGGLFAGAADELASAEWVEFFQFLEAEAGPTLTTLGQTVGNLGKGFAEMVMALDPFSDFFNQGLLGASESFERWAESLDETQGFQEFLDYVRATGPQVLDTLGSLGNGLLQIAEAAAPLGGPTLRIIEGFADAVALIADSPIGPPLMAGVAAMSALSLATAAFSKTSTALFATKGGASLRAGVKGATADLGVLAATAATAGTRTTREMGRASAAAGRLRGSLGKAGAGAALAAGGYAAMETGIIGSNTAMGAAIGLIAGPWGAAAGALIGATIDAASANDDFWESLSRVDALLGSNTASLSDQRAEVEKLRQKYLEFKDAREDNPDSSFLGGFAEQTTEWFTDTGGQIADMKNDIEGMFGNSDVEEMNAGLKEQEARLAENERSQRQVARARDIAAEASRRQTAAIQDTIQAMRDERAAALAAEFAEIAYAQAVDDASAAVKENGKTLDTNTQKGRANRTALLQLAAAWNNQSDEVKNSGKQHKAAVEDFVRTAVQMGMNEKAARQYAREVMEIPASRTTNVNLNVDEAKLAQIGAFMDHVFRDRTTTVRVVKTGDTGNFNAGGGLTMASGGTVPGRRRPYRDSVPALLAPGEEIISNDRGQADRNRALLKAINANRMAAGGTVGGDLRTLNSLLATTVPMRGYASGGTVTEMAGPQGRSLTIAEGALQVTMPATSTPEAASAASGGRILAALSAWGG